MKRILTNWWAITGLIIACLLLVFCVGLPIFVAFFRPWSVRVAFGVSIVAIWLGVGFWRMRRARKANEALAAELVAPNVSDQEQAAVSQRMGEALAALKAASGKRRDYLYSRPWYVIIGPPGAGKTTALLNSGLRFPFADQSLSGVGGTRNLDFWFADEAALVDTAGRYTTQDSDAGADAQGWNSLLASLKKHRPLQPINGVLVTIGVDELLKGDRASIDHHASLVRRRMAELRTALEIAVPVYLLLTKADLLAGFAEFFDDLDVEGRRAVLGATLPEGAKPDQATIVTAFDRLLAAQMDRQAKRLHEEVDQTRRSLILGFPAQMGGLRSRLARFVEGAFIAGDRPAGMLRGFYLTSGVQQGAPLDRILAGVADAYDTTTNVARQSGRTYFLNRLLTEVVFGEAGLVQTDAKARARANARLTGGLVAVAAAAAVVVVVWSVSFVGNRAFQSQLLTSAQSAATLTRESGVDLIEVRATDPDLEQSLNVLRALRDLPQGYAEQAAGQPGLFKTFGLYQSGHARRAVETYHDGLRRILLPRLLLRLEQYMAANAASPMALYEPLKVYLMLGGQGPMNDAAVRSWITGDWAGQQFPGADRAGVRKELSQHLDALLADKDIAVAWPERKAPLDGTAIASARASLQTLGLADRAYAVLRQKAAIDGGQPWAAQTVLAAGDAQAFANGEAVLAMQVPYFYTRAGFEKAYQIGLATVQQDMKRDLWVMGEDAATEGVQAQMSSIRPGVAALYSRDYIAAWDGVVAALKPGAYFTDAAAFGAFTKTPSPLKMVLLELRRNTTFSGGTTAAGGMAGVAMKQKLGRMSALVPTATADIDAGAQIQSYFKPIHDYVGDGKAPAPVDEFVAALKQAGAAVQSAKIAGGGIGSDAVQGQMAMAMGSVAGASAGAPPQLQGFVAGATQSGATAQVSAAQGAISEAYTASVLPDCKQTTQDKYPFFGNSAVDAGLVDVQKVFGMNGTIEGFQTQRMAPLLDTAGPVWRWKADNALAKALDPASPNEFAKAVQMRDMLVSGIAIKIEPQTMGAGIDAVEFAAGGTSYRFDAAATGARPVLWSAQGSLPQASVTVFKGTTQISKIETQGPWALFRLFDKAKRENAGAQALLATFGDGAQSVVFKISLPDDRNPFSRGGVWSFRCPTTL